MTRAMDQYLRPEAGGTRFCPGCGHGILLGALLRAVDRLKVPRDKLLFVSGIGCAAWIPSPNIAADTLHTIHGRAVAFATGAKLANPELEVIVVSGDGDLSSIGGNHLIHAARRNLSLTVICANNQIYGMTGGQTASTTPLQARSVTDPQGNTQRPFDLCRLVLAAGAEYAARFPVTRPPALINAIERALRTSGFTFVEALSPCPTQFGRRNAMGEPSTLFDACEAGCVEAGEIQAVDYDQLENTGYLIGEFSR